MYTYIFKSTYARINVMYIYTYTYIHININTYKFVQEKEEEEEEAKAAAKGRGKGKAAAAAAAAATTKTPPKRGKSAKKDDQGMSTLVYVCMYVGMHTHACLQARAAAGMHTQ
jgi:hypothetical protein